MGYNLSATFGYGVCIQAEDKDIQLLTEEQRDLVEDLYGTTCMEIEYGGSDGCEATYILHKDSIIRADWVGTPIRPADLTAIAENELVLGSELQMELLKNDIVVSGEHFKWWLLPRWF